MIKGLRGFFKIFQCIKFIKCYPIKVLVYGFADGVEFVVV
jgi:hypothetical protein